jgi:tetratricopeptide (TPR) repeat protein
MFHGLRSGSVVVILVVVLSGIGFSEEVSSTVQIQDLQKAAQQSISNNDLPTAKSKYQTIVDSYPQTTQAIDAKGRIICLDIQSGQDVQASQNAFIQNYAKRDGFSSAVLMIGSQLRKSGKAVQALELYQKSLPEISDPEQGVVLKRSEIDTQLEMDDLTSATANMKAMVSSFNSTPAFVKQAHEVAWGFVLKQEYATALEVYQGLLKQFPNHERAVWFQRSLVQTCLEQVDLAGIQSAVETLKTSFQVHPDYANQMVITADRLRGKKQYATAGGIYDTLLKQDPNDTQAVVWKRMQIQNNLDLGQKESAKAEVKTLFSTYQDNPELVKQAHELAWHFTQKKDFGTAIQVYSELQNQFPNHERAVWFQRSKVETYLEQGDVSKAISAVEQLKKNYKSHPDYANQMEKMAGILIDKNQPAVAQEVSDTLLKTFPEHERAIWFLHYKARSEIWMKDPNLAESTISRMRKDYAIHPDYADAMSWTAYNYRTSGDYPRGIALYQEVIDLNPPAKVQVRCLAGIAQAYARMGNDTQMQKTMDSLISKYKVSQSDGVAFYVFGIGEDYYYMAQDAAKVGDPNQISKSLYAKAVAVWQDFENAMPNHNSPQYPYFSGLVSQQLGQYEKAIVYYQKVISKWPNYEQTWHSRLMAVECLDAMKMAGKIDVSQADTAKQALYQEILQKDVWSPVTDYVRQTLNSQAQ